MLVIKILDLVDNHCKQVTIVDRLWAQALPLTFFDLFDVCLVQIQIFIHDTRLW